MKRSETEKSRLVDVFSHAPKVVTDSVKQVVFIARHSAHVEFTAADSGGGERRTVYIKGLKSYPPN